MASNPYNNIVKLSDGTTIMDITDTTATASDVASGKYFYAATGEKTLGTASGGGGSQGGAVWQDQDGYIHLSPDASGGSVTVESLSVTQNGTYTAPTGKAYSPVTVNVSGGGGGSVESKDVNFIDYDGTILHSYTKSEFASLNALPSNPSHTGLTAQGWNWTLANAKTYVAKYGALTIGQMYITDDGKTRIYIHLGEERKSPMLGVCPNGTVDVDWGDGTTHDTLTGTSVSTIKWTPTHNYAHGGDYVIKLTVTGSMGIVGSSNSYCQLLRHSSGADSRNTYYCNSINRVEIGNNVSIGNYAFYYCCSLTSLAIPDDVTSIGNYAFDYCHSLTSLTIPDSGTSVGAYAFRYCYSLTSLAIPDDVTSIGNYAFSSCYSLASLTIPDDVTSVGAYAFNSCYSLASLTIPDDVTSIGNYAFSSCYSLASLTIPDDVTSIGNSAFYNCYSLASLTIPDSVTSIGTSAFSGCYGIAEYHLLRTTPPTLSNTNAFTGIQSDCIIYAPENSLNDYKTTNNWSTYASYMQGE